MLPSIRSREALMCWEEQKINKSMLHKAVIKNNKINLQFSLKMVNWKVKIQMILIQRVYVLFSALHLWWLSNLLPLLRPFPQVASILSGRLLCIWGRGWRSCSPPADHGGCRLWRTLALSIHQEQSGVQIHPLNDANIRTMQRLTSFIQLKSCLLCRTVTTLHLHVQHPVVL